MKRQLLGDNTNTMTMTIVRRAAWRERQEERKQLEGEVSLSFTIALIISHIQNLIKVKKKNLNIQYNCKVLELLREEREREESLKKKPTCCNACLEICLIGENTFWNLFRYNCEIAPLKRIPSIKISQCFGFLVCVVWEVLPKADMEMVDPPGVSSISVWMLCLYFHMIQQTIGFPNF